MTTQQAFKKLLNSEKLLKAGEFKLGTIRQWNKRMADGEPPTIAVMEAALLKAGAKKIPEKWIFKNPA